MLTPPPPGHWQEIEPIRWPPKSGNIAGRAWRHKLMNMTVIRSRSTAGDGSNWIHVSVSRPDRIPTWAELSKVKDEFIGEDREAYQVLAARSDHVNIHPHCLHLWAPLDGKRCVANLRDLELEVGV